MFTKTKSIIYITKSKIKLVNVTMGKKPKEETIDEALWMPDSLESILLKFKKNVKGNTRILLSEDFVYVVTLSFPVGSFVNRNNVQEKAQELIPENLTETAWDYKVTGLTTIQVVAILPSLYEKLSEAIVKTGFRIEEIIPLSYVLASFAKNQDIPLLFVYKDEEILLALVQKGTVITTKRMLNANIDRNTINQFIKFTKDQFSIEPKTIIFCGDTSNINIAEFQNENLKLEIQNISPIVIMAYKEDLKGKDEDVLNIELMTILRKDHVSSFSTNKKNSYRKSIYIIAILLFVSLGIIGGFLAYRNTFLKKTKEPDKLNKITKATATPVLTTIPTPRQTRLTPSATSSAEINLSPYTISILNGSSIEGEATRLGNILKENGYNVERTGNADSNNYKKTEIRYKEKVPEKIIEGLDKLLKTRYDLSIGTKLEEAAESDVVIIIGKSIK